jgi:hypothetical protein
MKYRGIGYRDRTVRILFEDTEAMSERQLQYTALNRILEPKRSSVVLAFPFHEIEECCAYLNEKNDEPRLEE